LGIVGMVRGVSERPGPFAEAAVVPAERPATITAAIAANIILFNPVIFLLRVTMGHAGIACGVHVSVGPIRGLVRRNAPRSPDL
jgi:hypothetical protein